jgi:hypothetical protein
VVWFPSRTGFAQFDVMRSTYRGFRKTVSTVSLRNQVDAGCVKRSAAKYAQFMGQEHFLAANRIPLSRKNASSEDMSITARIAFVASVVLTSCMLIPVSTHAQDVPGIEICTVEKTMERRTSCLQSNVDFLQKTITKLAADHQQKLDAATRQIEGLKATVASLQKIVDDLQAAQKKALEDQKKKTDAPPAKDNARMPVDAKDGAK